MQIHKKIKKGEISSIYSEVISEINAEQKNTYLEIITPPCFLKLEGVIETAL
jgi:hypothetical protein